MATRSDLVTRLRQWQSGEISAPEIHAWATSLYPPDDFDDREGPEDNSVSNEVMSRLDSLDINLIVPDDIPIYLKFLETPAGQFDRAYANFEQELNSIDYEARRAGLRGVPPYSKILG